MNGITVIKIPNDKRLVFVSDLHLNHDKEFLWGKRGFESSEQHVETIFRQLGEIANDDTVLVNLGDATFRDNDRKYFDQLAALPFHAHYHIWGNHPSGAKQAYKEAIKDYFDGLYPYLNVDESIQVYPVKYRNVTFVGHQAFFKHRGENIFASHFPHSIWDEMKNGFWSLSGHSHGSFDETNGSRSNAGKTLDVGVETALRFNGVVYWDFDDVKVQMDNRDIVKKDHH